MTDKPEKTVSELLGEPFPKDALKQRQGQGSRQFTYVEGHTVIRRLNGATHNEWDLSIVSIDTMQLGPKTMVRAHVALTIPGLGRREHIGVQAVDERGGEDLVKGAITDALKKAATLFGVGLELYGPDYEAGELPPLPNRDRSTSRNTLPDAPHATQTHAEPKEVLPGLQSATVRQQEFIQALAQELHLSPTALDAESKGAFGVPVVELNRRDASIMVERLNQRRTASQSAMMPNHNAAERARQ